MSKQMHYLHTASFKLISYKSNFITFKLRYVEVFLNVQIRTSYKSCQQKACLRPFFSDVSQGHQFHPVTIAINIMLNM